MNLLLGFGKAHFEKARLAVQELALLIKEKEPVVNLTVITEEWMQSLGVYKFNGHEYNIGYIRDTYKWSKWSEHHGYVIEGTYSCYRDDHPMSSDGFACLQVHFCLTIQDDDVWERREYIAIGGE